MTAEHERLQADDGAWKHWGPYLAERAWATVREDYSPYGTAWEYFPHDHARSRAYRWNEDGLAGICDDDQHMCFALALWNGNDTILKERLVAAEEEPDDEEDEVEVDERGEPLERLQPRRPGEFVCQSCFLVKHPSQLADANRLLCTDCV